ncbi:MAG: acyl-homoserine-lactone synthase [Paracoccaceae bacterium]
MQSTTLSFENMHNHGELFANILRARRQSFIVQNRWNLPEALGMEYDQYDTPASRWVAIHEFGEVLGGVRLTPTTARCGIYSYMIRDAQKGLLDSIPKDLLDFEAPVDGQVWEATRGFVAHSVPAAKRRVVHARMVMEMARTARELGITRMLALLPTNWTRWANRCHLDMKAAGRVMTLDGVEYQAVTLRVAAQLH